MREKQFPQKPNPSGSEETKEKKLAKNPSSLHFHPDHYLGSCVPHLVLLARHRQVVRQERSGEDTARYFAGN
jgi:hypothetical protein